MPQKQLIEKASDPVGGGQTGVSKSADPHGGKASLPNSKDQGEPMQKIAAITPGQGEEETDSQNNTKPTADTSAQNKASVAMKEEIASLFGDDLSEEFREKAVVIFEAAVAEKASAVIAEREAALEEEFNASVTQFTEEMTTKVDEYLNYVVEQWMEENQVAIESSLRSEITEEFMEGLKKLFTENYMEVPENKVDVVTELASKVEELESRLNDVINENIDLKGKLEETTQKEIFDQVSEGMVVTQVEKFRALSEGVEYDSADDYIKKLGIVKEHYFAEKKTAKSIDEQEAVELEEEVVAQSKATGPVSNYVSAISRTIKK
jgi:hypothetical protein